MPLPTIFFSTNTGNYSKHANCIFRIIAEIDAALQGRYTIVRSIESDSTTILHELRRVGDDLAIFHFDGHADDFQELLDAAQAMGITSLPGYLASLPQLQLVFLNYCSSPRFIDSFRDAGVRMVIGSSHSKKYNQIVKFSTAFYRLLLLNGYAAATAYEEAIRIAEIRVGSQPYYAAFFHDRREHPQQSDKMATPRSPAAEELLHNDEPAPTPTSGTSSGANGTRVPPQPSTPPSSIPPSSTPSGLPPLPARILLPAQPFPGIRPYQAEDARVFFGRDTEITQLYNRLTHPTAQPILLLSGQAGVGKSSLLAAGLLPHLEDQYEIHKLNGEQAPRLYKALCEEMGIPNATVAAEQFWDPWHTPQQKNVLLVVDQIETQLFDANRDAQFDLAQFMTAIDKLVSRTPATLQHRVIFSVRDTTLTRLYSLPFVTFLPSYAQDFSLARLDRMGIQNVLRGFSQSPHLLSHYQLAFEDGLEDEISTSLTQDQDSAIAPFLQALLTRLWQEARSTVPHQLSRDRYTQLLSDDNLFHDFLAAQLQQLRQRRSPFVDAGQAVVLLAYHTPALGAVNGRTFDEIRSHLPHWNAEALRRLLAYLTALYLLTETAGSGAQRTRIGHHLLAGPIAHAQYPFARYMEWFRRLLTNLRFLPARLARAVAPETQRFFTELLQLCRQEGDLLLRPLRHRRAIPAIGTCLLLVLFFVATSTLMRYGLLQIDDTPYIGELAYPKVFVLSPVEREEGRLEKVVEFIGGVDPVRFGVDVAAKRLDLLHAHSTMPVAYADQAIRSLAFSPDLSFLFAANYDNTLESWSLTAAQPHLSLQALTNTAHLLAMDRQGRFLIYAGADGRAGILWLDPLKPVELPPHQGPVTSGQVSPDGNLIFTSGRDGKIHQYDINTGQFSALRCDSNKPVVALAIHPGNRVIACADTDQRIYLVDTLTGQTLYRFTGHYADVKWLEFSPDGDHLLSTGYDETVRIWQLSIGAEVHRFTEPTAAVNAAHYSPDGALIIAAGDDGFIRIWGADTYGLVEMIEAHPSGVSALAIRADGQQLASAGWNGDLTLWDISFLASRSLR